MKKTAIVIIVVMLMVVVSAPAFSASGSVSGGGQIRESSQGYKISFGGWAAGGDYYYGGTNNQNASGEWQINFHNVGVDAFDKTKFHGTVVSELNYYVGDSGSCDSAMNLTVHGKWKNQAGYHVILRAGDDGSPGSNDTLRVTLFNGSTIVYDTHWAGEFGDESDCVGTARTGLDTGNATITLP
jgi:hypothetical protein